MIKKVEIKELREIAKFLKSIFVVHNVFEKDLNSIVEYLKDKVVLVAVDDNVIKGVVVVVEKNCIDGKYHSINHLAVKAEYRRRGIGRELIEEALMGIDGIVEFKITDKRLFGLAESLGFKLSERKENYYREGETAYVWKNHL